MPSNLDYKKFNPIDKILEQCLWVSTFMKHGENRLCFNTENGVVLYKKEEVGKPFHHKNLSIKGSSEEIYSQYLTLIEIKKEKAFINNKREGMFDTHSLMRAKYYSHGREAMTLISKNNPELLI